MSAVFCTSYMQNQHDSGMNAEMQDSHKGKGSFDLLKRQIHHFRIFEVMTTNVMKINVMITNVMTINKYTAD